MRKAVLGVLLGAAAGVLDVAPMIFMGLDWSANFSAFFHWVVTGFFISVLDIRAAGWLKGLVVSVLGLIPMGFLVWWNDSSAVAPMCASTLVFGVLLGVLVEKGG